MQDALLKSKFTCRRGINRGATFSVAHPVYRTGHLSVQFYSLMVYFDTTLKVFTYYLKVPISGLFPTPTVLKQKNIDIFILLLNEKIIK